jgi:hypothetical protein
VRQLAHATHLSVTLVYRWPFEKLGLTERHLRWMPNVLSDHPKITCVQYSKSLLTILWAQKEPETRLIRHRDPGWVMIPLDDGPWTHVASSWWKSSGSGRCHNSVQKVMLIIVWCRSGFAVVTAVENACKGNANDYVGKLLTLLS